MGSVREEIAELGIETTSYEGQGISMRLSKKDINQILSLVCKRIEGKMDKAEDCRIRNANGAKDKDLDAFYRGQISAYKAILDVIKGE